MNITQKDIGSIVIFRALQLGDLLCAVPAFRALRLAFPKAHIAILGLSWMQSFVDCFHEYVDEFIRFPGYPGLPEQPVNVAETSAFITEMQSRGFDLAIQLQGNGSVVNPMIELFGAGTAAGFFRKEDYYPGENFILYPERCSEIHRHLLLMEHLGIAQQGDHLEFPITPRDEEDLEKASLPLAGKPYICVHAGSRGAWRQWPPGHFAQLADIAADRGYRIVLTGTSDELNIVQEVAGYLKTKPVIAAGKTNLGAMAALIKNSAGLISNCTGVSHIASALRIKSVVISMDGEPHRWAPLNKKLHYTIDWTRHPDFRLTAQAVADLFANVP